MSFLWYRGGLSLLLWYRDLFFRYWDSEFCCSAFLGSTSACLFWASTSCKFEVKEDLHTEKKIEKGQYPKKTSRYQLKESPSKITLQNTTSPQGTNMTLKDSLGMGSNATWGRTDLGNRSQILPLSTAHGARHPPLPESFRTVRGWGSTTRCQLTL